ncbi:MAG: CRISPR-associated primase-polymerase type A1 [Polyangiales bacterium]
MIDPRSAPEVVERLVLEGREEELRALLDEVVCWSEAQRAELVSRLVELGRLALVRERGWREAPALDVEATLEGESAAPVDEDPSLEDDEVLFRSITPTHDRADEELFSRFFGGRRDLYARQWHDARRDRAGYRPVQEPLTPEVVRAHLEGRITIGQYLLFPDGTVSFGVIDLDLARNAVDALRAAHGEDVSPLAHAGLGEYARAVLEAARSLGLALFAEDSGAKGIHLWIFFEPRRPARAARALLAQLVRAAGPQPADVSVEIFPKQESAGPRGLSSLVKLPLGIHQRTLRRCRLLGASLEPIESSHEALLQLAPAEPSLIDAILAHRLAPLPAPWRGPLEPAPVLPSAPLPRSIAAALRGLSDADAARAAEERMLEGCGVLRAIVDAAYRDRVLSADEGRALTYSLGLVGAGPGLIDEVLAHAHSSLEELRRVRRGLPSPVGCKKLRLLPTHGASCSACPRVANARPYASPAFFAVGSVAPSSPKHAPFADWLDADESAVTSPLAALGEALDRIERRIEHLERRGEHGGPDASSDERSP